MTLSTAIALVLSGLGAIMILLAAAGLLRFPDIYTRSHAAGKAATLGVCTVLLGCALGLAEPGAWIRSLVAVVFLFVTIPVGAQLVARAAFRNGALPAPETRIDPAVGGLEREAPPSDGGATPPGGRS
ncbi:MAG: monovalent cation/H(+) antiporter subunit G [Candidatus Eiseniibacteriota bacterium]|jgi:multicomponent Na+:H+ antiporter subunit G